MQKKTQKKLAVIHLFGNFPTMAIYDVERAIERQMRDIKQSASETPSLAARFGVWLEDMQESLDCIRAANAAKTRSEEDFAEFCEEVQQEVIKQVTEEVADKEG